MDSDSGQLEDLLDALESAAAGIRRVDHRDQLDAAADGATLLILEGPDAANRIRAWAGDRAGWFVLDDPPEDIGIAAPVATLAQDPMPPGRWRGGAPPAAAPPEPSGELGRAFTARAALVDSQRHDVDRVRAQLIEQRAWVAAETERVRASQSWRLGHGLARTLRRLTLRRDRGTDALQRIVDRMNEPVDR